jgi:hypothetical protein
MNIINLNNDCLAIIISFLDCRYFLKELKNIYTPTTFYLINKRCYQLYKKYNKKCKYKIYKKLKSCSCIFPSLQKRNFILFEKLKAKNKVIDILKQATYRKEEQGYIDTIHFDNSLQVRYANKYLNEFGIISHRCCDGLGVVYNNLEKKEKWSKRKELMTRGM